MQKCTWLRGTLGLDSKNAGNVSLFSTIVNTMLILSIPHIFVKRLDLQSNEMRLVQFATVVEQVVSLLLLQFIFSSSLLNLFVNFYRYNK